MTIATQRLIAVDVLHDDVGRFQGCGVVQTEIVSTCVNCTTVAVRNAGDGTWDIKATTEALIHGVRSDRLRTLRGDVALEDMLDLLASDMQYTIVSYLECQECGGVVFWGLCIRGNPIFEHVDKADVDNRRWEPVPPREQWSRTS